MGDQIVDFCLLAFQDKRAESLITYFPLEWDFLHATRGVFSLPIHESLHIL